MDVQARGGVVIVADDHTFGEGGQELTGSVEVGHLDVGRAERVGNVRVAPRAGEKAVFVGEVGRPLVQVMQRRLGVDHLDGVHHAGLGELDEGSLRQVAPHRVERMGHVHHTALGVDQVGGLPGGDAERHPIGEEEPDDLAGMGAQFLPDDDATRKDTGQLFGAAGGVVVGDAQHVETTLDHGLLQLIGRGGRVTRPHRVAVEVDANPSRSLRFAEVGVANRRGGGLRHGGEGTVLRRGAPAHHGDVGLPRR